MKIREIKFEDAEAFLELWLQLDNETRYILLEPDEHFEDIVR